MNRKMAQAPERIASLLPSATEICFALGLGDRVVGVSHECDFPPEARRLPVLTAAKLDPGGSSADIHHQVAALVANGLSVYRVDEERLRDLRPNLIVTQDTCEVCAVSFEEDQRATRRWLGAAAEIVSLSPLTLADVLEDIVRVGRAAGADDRAREIAEAMRRRIDGVREVAAELPRPRVLWLEWLDPPMVAGHWTPELIRIAGGEPVLAHERVPTHAVAWERIAACGADVMVVAPCGFSLEQTRRELPELLARPAVCDLPAVRAGRVALADGNAYFNRPGPRLAESAEIAALAIHPNRFRTRFDYGQDALATFPVS